MSRHSRSQGAIEYLLTYGWAVLIVTIVLALLFASGAVNLSIFATSGCIPSSGYSCTQLVLSSTGYISAVIGTPFRAVQITGFGCSNGGYAPSSFMTPLPNGHIALASGQTALFVAKCTLKVNETGAPFSGSLWIRYNTFTKSNQTSEVATLSTEVSTGALGVNTSSTTATSTTTIPTSANATNCGFNNQEAPCPSPTTLEISTTQPNELILVAADGTPSSTPTVTVDANPATMITISNMRPSSLYPSGSGSASLFYYVAPSSGLHTISITSGFYSSLGFYYAKALSGYSTAGLSYVTAQSAIGTDYAALDIGATVPNSIVFVTSSQLSSGYGVSGTSMAGSPINPIVVYSAEGGYGYFGTEPTAVDGYFTAPSTGSYSINVSQSTAISNVTAVAVALEP